MASGVSKPFSSLKVKSSSADDVSDFLKSKTRGENSDLTTNYVLGTDEKDLSDNEVKLDQSLKGFPARASIIIPPFCRPTSLNPLRVFFSPEEFEKLRLASDDPDLEPVRERLRNMIQNVEGFTPWLGDLDIEKMDLEELQLMLFQVRNIEQSILDDEDVFDFIDYGGLEMITEDTPNRTTQAYPVGQEETTDCMVCLEVVKLNKRICCDYEACDTCITRYIETKVNDGVVKIACLNDSCDSFIYRDEILGRMPVDMKDKYYRFLVDANKDPKVKTCPRCSHIHHLSEEDSQRSTKYGLIVICPMCNFDWCFECQAPRHPRIKCKDYKKGDRLLKQWSKEKHYGVMNAQKCPKCKIYIQQSGGCDHMTCSKCDTHFCYKCGDHYVDLKFLGNHHSRYSLVGCKFNYQPNRPVLRKFVRGSNFAGRLFGGLLLLGVGAAAIGVLCGASVIIVPAFLGYKYNKHRKLKRRLIRQIELMENSSNNTEIGFHWERIRGETRDIAIVGSETRENLEPIHIGIQTGQSQQVDVTVHNPYTPDSLENGESFQTSEIRMNISDEMGQVTLTTAEISHNANGSDGKEAEIVLHVKTSYPKKDTVTSTEEPQDMSEANKSSKEIKSSTNTTEPTKGSSTVEGKPKPSQVIRQVHSTGSLKKAVKKQEIGSISRKWCMRSSSSKSTSDESDTPFDPTRMQSLLQASDDKNHLADPEQTVDHETLTQSGCFLTLFGKKIIEKDKIYNSKFDSSPNVDKNVCPEGVNCALVSDRIKDSADKKIENDFSENVEKDKVKEFVPTETVVTHF
ncbi:hypothetical protein ACF0H5_022819 [Mactra antiquata]